MEAPTTCVVPTATVPPPDNMTILAGGTWEGETEGKRDDIISWGVVNYDLATNSGLIVTTDGTWAKLNNIFAWAHMPDLEVVADELRQALH